LILSSEGDVPKDPKVVLEAMKQDGNSLKFARKEFQSSKMIVLEAVKQCGSSFQFASKELQVDKEIAWMATHHFKLIKSITTLFNVNFKFTFH
jgi:hypothetical protein